MVLVEGFKNADFEKVVVYRNEEEFASITTIVECLL